MDTAKLLQQLTLQDDIQTAFFYKQSLVVLDEDGVLASVSLKEGQTHRVQLPVRSVAAVPLEGGAQIGILTASGWLHVFNSQTGDLIAKKDMRIHKPGKLAVDLDGKKIAAFNAQGSIAIWDISQDKPLMLLQLKKSKMRLVAVHSDGSLLIVGKKGELIFFDASRRWKKRQFTDSIKDVNGMVIGHKAEFAIFATATGFVELWSLETGRRQIQLASTQSGWAAVAEDGRFDGDVHALDDIEWRDKKVSVTVNAFTEEYFSPGLLSRAITVGPKSGDVKNIREGVMMPPEASLRVTSQTDANVNVEVQASEREDGGVDEVRLYLNGRLITSPPEKGKTKQESITRNYAIELAPGTNVLEAVAFNSERLEGVSDKLILVGPGTRKPGRLHLIVIGLNTYANSALDLNYAVSDADGVIKALKTPQGPFSGVEVRYIRNEEATKSAILAGIRYLQGMPREDMVFIYYAGHGVAAEDEWYLIAHEAKGFANSSEWKRAAISSKELRKLIEGAGPDKIFMAIDACQSGQSVDVLSQFKGIRSLRLLARTVGVHILAATTSKQVATELEALGHGVFTYSLLRALGGKSDIDPANGHVSAIEIMRHVEKEVPPLSRHYADQEQYPTLHSRGNDYDVIYIAP